MRDEQRWEDLESRLTFQEEHIHQLSLTVARQQGALDALLREMRELRRQLAVVLPHASPRSHEDGPPPHY